MGRLVSTQQATQLSALARESKEHLCQELRHSPLAIKWFVLASAAGRPASTLLNNQSELLRYCVESVYLRLSVEARRTLLALHLLGREGALGEIAILVSEPVGSLARAMQELSQGSLVVSRISDGSDMETFLSLTDTARAYLKSAIDPSDPDLLAIAKQESVYRASEEERTKRAAGRSLAPWIVRADSDTERPAAHLLYKALVASKDSLYAEAAEHISRAREISPDYWEVDRVHAFISGSGNLLPPDAVTHIYLSALALARDETARAVVSHFLAGHLARKSNDPAHALKYAEAAHATLASAETAMALGNISVRLGNFAEGIQLLRRASGELQGKSRLIAKTALMGSYRRHAEDAMHVEKSLKHALERCLNGLEVGVDLQGEGVFDDRYRDEFCELQALLLRIEELGAGSNIPLFYPTDLFVELTAGVDRLRNCTSFPILASRCRHASERIRSEPGFEDYASRIEAPSPQHATGEPLEGSDELIGEVCYLRSTYGFIRHPDFPDNCFFHEGAVEPRGEFHTLSVGTRVSFTAAEEDGRMRAGVVRLMD